MSEYDLVIIGADQPVFSRLHGLDGRNRGALPNSFHGGLGTGLAAIEHFADCD